MIGILVNVIGGTAQNTGALTSTTRPAYVQGRNVSRHAPETLTVLAFAARNGVDVPEDVMSLDSDFGDF